ncbi:uncharacterized protein GIQ15_03721 [Arthroderma uncinatum]|uniref:uncharacterized protein n=1 Tax=Arthroderma uncinatum TaxID=74035 RepID=UPI00144A667E|nr:uncharacterized protein GIQ15_03721 [Arthroderma uncinatum]KAF3484397.1 hypothetical protein GIQ15_03721 [Arthroderma uncinatum]
MNEDTLPNMPTWQDSTTRRVEDTSRRDDEMEMSHLNPVTGHSVVDDGAGRGSGYYHVPPQPASPLYPKTNNNGSNHNSHQSTGMTGYRGTDPSISPNASAIGIAHSPGYGPAYGQGHGSTYMDPQTTGQIYPSRYQTQSPSTIGGPGGDVYGYANTRSFTRSPAQRTRATPSPGPQISPVHAYSPDHSGLPYPTRPYSPAQSPQQHPQQPQRSYTAYSPSTATPPPPWSATDQTQGEEQGQGQVQGQGPRAPSLLMAGRRPVENSWRDV